MKDFTMIECTACSKWFYVLCDDENICEENIDDTGSVWLCRECIIIHE